MRRTIMGAAILAACAGPAALAAPLEDGQIIARLRDYLRIDTSNPPGNEIRAARFFRDWFAAEGIEARIFEYTPGRAIVIARLQGSGAKRALVLSNHMDVVQVERPFWSVDPFGGVLQGGFVYGRGALDMKTTGLLEAAVLINLKRAGAPGARRGVSRNVGRGGRSDRGRLAGARAPRLRARRRVPDQRGRRH
jgi:acetylornithine deacetylase/succinyl-diaminopimelate desuccinylase-like protein